MVDNATQNAIKLLGKPVASQRTFSVFTRTGPEQRAEAQRQLLLDREEAVKEGPAQSAIAENLEVDNLNAPEKAGKDRLDPKDPKTFAPTQPDGLRGISNFMLEISLENFIEGGVDAAKKLGGKAKEMLAQTLGFLREKRLAIWKIAQDIREGRLNTIMRGLGIANEEIGKKMESTGQDGNSANPQQK